MEVLREALAARRKDDQPDPAAEFEDVLRGPVLEATPGTNNFEKMSEIVAQLSCSTLSHTR